MDEQRTSDVALNADEMMELLALFPAAKDQTRTQFRLSTKLQQHILEREDHDEFLNKLADSSLNVRVHCDDQHVDKKVECIKIVRSITKQGLKEAKDFVEGTYDMTMTREQYRQMKDELGRYGAQIILLTR